MRNRLKPTVTMATLAAHAGRRVRALAVYVVPAVLALILLGPASATAQTASGGWKWPWSKPAKPPTPTYAELAEQQQQRNVNAPGLGLNQQTEPSRTAKMAAALSPSAIGRSVSSSFKQGTEKVKQGTQKVTGAFQPKPPSETAWPFNTNPKTKEKLGPDFYVSLARIQEQTGNVELAEEQYHKALKLDPKHSAALQGYAGMLERQGKLPKAAEYYQRAIKAHPDDAMATNNLGLCYARQGEYRSALVYLNKAVELKPDRDLYRNNIAKVLVQQGRVDEAIAHVTAVYGEPAAHYNVGLMLHQQGEREAAAEQFAIALEQNPNLDQARQWLAEMNHAVPVPRQQVAARQPAAEQEAGPALVANPHVPSDTPRPSVTGSPGARMAIRPSPTKPAPQATAPYRQAVESTPPAGQTGAAGIPPSPDEARRQSAFETDPASVRLPTSTVARPVPYGYVPPSRY
ncbi:MAG: tetratricopeptide repeat protein [Planctomycetia bacterium]|nr:tetratricopeptide repeat protein [Planctomycetia bacterium]